MNQYRDKVTVKILLNDPTMLLPRLETEGSVGYDAILPKDVILVPFEAQIVRLGFRVELPHFMELQIRARSSISLMNIIIPNGIGTIDSDFRGEVGVILLNLNKENKTLKQGTRVCQLVPKLCYNIQWSIAKKRISETMRGDGGFGSTGLYLNDKMGDENEI